MHEGCHNTVHAGRGPCHRLSIRAHNLVAGQELNLGAEKCIAARRQRRHVDRVGNQNAPVYSLRAKNGVDKIGRKMMAVADQAGAKPVSRQLRPQRVSVPVHHLRAAVAQVRAETGPGCSGFVDVLCASIRVADRHDHTGCARAADEVQSPWQLRSQCYDSNASARRRLEFLKFAPIRPSHVMRVVGAARAIRRDVWTLQVVARRRHREFRISPSSLLEDAEVPDEPLLRVGNQRGAE